MFFSRQGANLQDFYDRELAISEFFNFEGITRFPHILNTLFLTNRTYLFQLCMLNPSITLKSVQN